MYSVANILLFDMQGVLSIIGETRRVIVQGVYELFEKEPSTEWESEDRVNRLVFIGQHSSINSRPR